MPPDGLDILIMGTTDYAEVLLDTHEASVGGRFVGFLENLDRSRCGDTRMGLPVYWFEDSGHMAESAVLTCALATPARRSWIGQAKAAGFRFTRLIYPSSVVSARTRLEDGVIVDPLVVIAGFSEIGAHVRIGRGSTIGHHTRIGAFATLHPGCRVSGRTVIGEGVIVGTGAVLIDGVTVGERARIAAGAVVTRDVEPGSTVRGNPARVVGAGSA